MSRVGFIGVGTMGFPMACNIISKGNDLKFYDSYVHKENKKHMVLSDRFLRFKKFQNLNFQRSKI